jgi:L-asparaginase
MRRCSGGLQVQSGYLAEQMAQIPELKQPVFPKFEILEYQPILDSSNMTPEHWLKIAAEICANYQRFDGFVILHGTDTMAYTASALPLMLRGLGKCVILTGSQLPLADPRNDARENLKTGLLLAANKRISEVCLLFGERLLRGCRSTKVSASRFNAFDSPNFPPLGTIGATIELHGDRLLPPRKRRGPLVLDPIRTCDIATFRLFPGVSTNVLTNLLQSPLRALVLETYGVGNGPSNDQSFLNALRKAVDNGTIIVNCSQCLHGCVSQTAYETGSRLGNVGVVSGYDMTIEAAVVKLMYLFSGNRSIDQIKQEMQRNLVGELTPPDTTV